jgi:hypothetical protein
MDLLKLLKDWASALSFRVMNTSFYEINIQ